MPVTSRVMVSEDMAGVVVGISRETCIYYFEIDWDSLIDYMGKPLFLMLCELLGN
jgi:hypothetical protein